MNKKTAALASQLLLAVAAFFVTTACMFLGHRPDTPEELLH
ncbi:cyclic lactone autoinducer peptide [Paenibacillus thermoaerophilus]|uniref:Cyclic lactone autoinducer peptide n=1 Tax=Paenibacillus thermoaerophilus TaxID=1215385 RepID=A0ABW2UYY9_9BACL|nr:cyclic lactone autoinducer peptide [Paenibacillus thermoaerophilus]TMV16025.1 cyclic lactone autoinducer peptide [Paenibacillus thermoaerophilus]